MRILGLPGGLEPSSGPDRLLACAAATAAELDPPAGPLEVDVFDAEALRRLPHFSRGGAANGAEAVSDLRGAVTEADGLLISTPEDNCSYPGVFKDAIDWLSMPDDGSVIRSLPAAVIGASGDDFGADWAQADLRKILDAAGARVLASELSLPYAENAFDPDSNGSVLIDRALGSRLERLLAELGSHARAARESSRHTA